MITYRFYVNPETSVLKLRIYYNQKRAALSLEVKLNEDDLFTILSSNKPVPKLRSQYSMISRWRAVIDNTIFALQPKLNGMSVADIRDAVAVSLGLKEEVATIDNRFVDIYEEYMNSRQAPRTKELYRSTLNRMMLYDPNLGNLSIDAINLEWLRGFESSLVPLCPTANARAIHMRNIRAVFNYAIDMEKTTAYPFRKFKIKTEKTRKRALTAEQMHTLVTYPCTPAQEKYRDIFVLSFMLCGINIVDLVNLKEIVNGRIEYKRHKTGRLYSIKVHSEAMKIIEKYRGEAWLLDILDRNKNYKNYAKRLNEALRHIGPWERTSRGGKIIYTPLYPQITSYWARHTWASIASRLEIPKETIAHALGHGEDTVTDIYIDFDQRKVDEANQRVIDYVIRGGGET